MTETADQCASEYREAPEGDRRCIQRAGHKPAAPLHFNRTGFAWSNAEALMPTPQVTDRMVLAAQRRFIGATESDAIRSALTAVYPLIETEVRGRVIDEVDAIDDAALAADPPDEFRPATDQFGVQLYMHSCSLQMVPLLPDEVVWPCYECDGDRTAWKPLYVREES